MTDTTHKAPERIWINKVYGQHPEDWDFTDGKHLTKRQLAVKVEYVRADLVQAAVAAALREAANELEHEKFNWISKAHPTIDACAERILDLITPDAQAALDRMLAARLGRIRIAVVELSLAGDLPAQAVEKILAAIREGGE